MTVAVLVLLLLLNSLRGKIARVLRFEYVCMLKSDSMPVE